MEIADTAISVSDLVKVYHPRTATPVRALDGLTLKVRRGEIFGLLGKNGAGKTTLLRILTTLTPPTSGSVSVLGLDVVRQGLEVRKNLCVVLQENAVEIYLSVVDNLATYARFHSVPLTGIPARAERVMHQFGLTEHRNQKVIDLSGGLKRRVQVAKVFMVDKPVVFLDEATTGMDPINKRATLNAVRDQARIGRTIFLTTHILEEAEELCDTIALIDRGRVIASGGLPKIKAMIPGAFEVSITFASLPEETLREIRLLPLLTCTSVHNTVEARVRGNDFSTLENLAGLARRSPVIHFEVRSATLEDVFVELLGPTMRPDNRGGAGLS
jgi:ABC-2 type transport system ATP-binding protein